MTNNIETVQITDLSSAPSLSGTTEFMLQRLGIKKAEKSNLSSLSKYLTTSPEFVQAISSSSGGSLSLHLQAIDPHGNRSYSDSKLSTHVGAIDPHGDRLFSSNLVTTAISNHLSTNDPHNIKPYVDDTMTQHKDEVDPHGLVTYVNSTVNSLNSTIEPRIISEVDQKVEDIIGVRVAPLDNGKVPLAFVYKNLERKTTKSFFPATGDEDMLYIATTTDDLYYWSNGDYRTLKGTTTGGTSSYTTDDIPEGTLRDRLYLSTVLKNKYNNKISNVISQSLVSSIDANRDVRLKEIEGASNIEVVSEATKLIIRDNFYEFTGTTTNSETKNLVDSHNKLTNIQINKKYSIIGTIDMESKSELNGVPYIQNFRRYNIETTFANNYSKKFIESAKFSGLGFSTDNTILNATHSRDLATLSIYDKSYNLLESDIVIPDGDVTVVVPEGEYVYVQAKFDGHNSFTTPLKTSFKTTTPTLTGLNYSTDLLQVYGNTGSNVYVTLLDSGSVELSDATADCYGNFSLILTEALLVGSTYTLNLSGYSQEVNTTFTVTSQSLSGVSNIIPNKVSKVISGITQPEVTVSIFDSVTSVLVGETTSDLDGVFRADVDYSLIDVSGDISIKIKKDVLENTPFIFKLDNVTTTNTLPIPVGYESISFGEVYENPTNTSERVNLEYEGSSIKVKVTGVDGLTVNWKANLKILEELI